MKSIGFIIRGVISTVALALCAFALFYVANVAYDFTNGFAKEQLEDSEGIREISITVPSGSTAKDIAAILHDGGLIRNELIFRLMSRLNDYDSKYKKGTFSLNTGMDENSIMLALQESSNDISQVRLQIIEGYTLKQIAAEVEKAGFCTAEEFIKAANEGEYDYEFLKMLPDRANKLEGYLFPDTYFFKDTATAESIVSRMLSQFERVYIEEYKNKATDVIMSTDDVIKAASIIEAEVKYPPERSKVAGVIANRLGEGMPLQMCSTIMYALDKRKEVLYDSDLKVESPYNTYINKGLPVGPICNPGREAIRAALNPEHHDYIYFVLKDEETGEHVFTNDYNAFLDAKREYKQRF